jgi:hypothetical protein
MRRLPAAVGDGHANVGVCDFDAMLFALPDWMMSPKTDTGPGP